jgi:hypothetical protein
MKAIVSGIAALTAPALAQNGTTASLLHTSTSFDLLVHASYAETAPLFGPEGERAWAGKHWNPEFIHPLPAADTEGAVFTIQHGPLKAVWVNTAFNLDARHFQYVYFLPDILVTAIDVRFEPSGPESTKFHVLYTRTALTAEGNEHVTQMTESDKCAGRDWQHAIDLYLAARKANR